MDALVKNLLDNHFKYLSQEFSGDLLELKQKGVYPYECIWTVLKCFLEMNYLIDVNFIVL